MGHKSRLGKFFKNENISSIVSDHKATRLDINYRKKSIKISSTWKLDNTFQNNQYISKYQKGNKICLEINKNENRTTQKLWDVVKQCWEVYKNTSLHQETRDTSNKQLNLTPKSTR